MRFAVLGAGRIGKVHAAAISSVHGAELAAVADAAPDAARRLVDDIGGAVLSIPDIAASDDIDAVVICTPTDTHASLIELFARAGKAIFCEKPIDLDLPRVKQCLNVVDESGAFLMIGFNRRFDADFRSLRKVIDDGQIGSVEMVTITSRDPGPPPLDTLPQTGGIFRDMTIHDFDVARWMLGEEIETVMASASVLTDPVIGHLGDFDSVNVILRTARGAQAVITNSRRATYGYDQRIEVHGARGAAQAHNTHQANVEVADQDGYHRPPLLDFFITRYKAAYAAEIAAFVRCVEAGDPPPTTGHDGLMALALADAALISVTEERAVKLSEILG